MLSRSRIGTLSLLAVASGYVLTRIVLPSTGWLPATWPGSLPYGALQAFFEAGTVGGLADWFAVTALFRHPFGVPIPHTNLLVRNREALEKNLATTVTGFMTPEVILSLVEVGALGQAVARVVTAPGTAAKVAGAVHSGLDQALEKLGQASPMIGMFLQGTMGGETMNALVQQVVNGIQERIGDALAQESTDAMLRAQIEHTVRKAFEQGLHHQLADAIRLKIATMPDRDLVAFVEGRVGRDLQVIRLNGAIVGGLAGMMLHVIDIWLV